LGLRELHLTRIVKVEQPKALGGQRVAWAIFDGSWAVQEFQCRHQELPGNRNRNRNWFAVDAFVEALRSAGVDVDALGPAPEDAS
jgi:hypothetical protein